MVSASPHWDMDVQMRSSENQPSFNTHTTHWILDFLVLILEFYRGAAMSREQCISELEDRALQTIVIVMYGITGFPLI
jgi:hypothetical protein